MASLDDLKKRISSVKSTQKITKAMKMVAAAKLKRAQDSAEKGRPYSQKMNNIILNYLVEYLTRIMLLNFYQAQEMKKLIFA